MAGEIINPWDTNPRKVSILMDNQNSWIEPYAKKLESRLRARGETVKICRKHSEIQEGAAAFFLACVRVVSPQVLAKNKYNLVVHPSDLPKGRGFSPLYWQILEGKNEIPVCLFRAVEEVDAGDIIYRETIRFEGHELIGEMREILGEKTIELCGRFMNEAEPITQIKQAGEPTRYPKRTPEDSRLDPKKSIADQFNLLRIVDNDRFPPFFDYSGHRYKLTINKCPDEVE